MRLAHQNSDRAPEGGVNRIVIRQVRQKNKVTHLNACLIHDHMKMVLVITIYVSKNGMCRMRANR